MPAGERDDRRVDEGFGLGHGRRVNSGGEAMDFDALMTRLEAIVAKLEKDDLPLEKAIEAYEEGVGLARRGQARLDEAERRLEELTQRGTVPLDVEEEGE